MQLSREFFERLEENGNVVHEVCRAQMTYFDYNIFVLNELDGQLP